MKKIYLLIAMMISTVFAQVSVNELRKLSNEQLDLIRTELTNSQATISNESTLNSLPEIVEIIPPEIIPPEEKKNSQFFGYNYFNKEINFFDNIPTPANYKLGPGDQITINLWGETNKRDSFTINKDGLIYYQNIGFINLSNKTVDEANELLTNTLSEIYSTLSNNNTSLMVEVGKLKSINVFFSGHIKQPGIHLIHPFSDVYSGIVQAGGVETSGSLRKIEIIRSGIVIAEVDFYSFFTTGKNNFSSIRLIDGDVIHIPKVDKRSQIGGAVVRPGIYESIKNETIFDMLNYAGGLNEFASSSGILSSIIPLRERKTDDDARTSKEININEFSKISFNNGDVLNIQSINDVKSMVEVLGRVKNPGLYPASATLKKVLDLSGGFGDPIYRESILEDQIIVLRKDSTKYGSKEFSVTYANSDKFVLKPEDKIFVYENINYKNTFYFTIDGEVNKPGPYNLSKGVKIGDAISIAGGFTPNADQRALTLISGTGDKIANIDDNTLIINNSRIIVSSITNSFSVDGNVYTPGFIATSGPITVQRAIELSGGLRQDTLKRDIYIVRSNGSKEMVKTGLGRRSKRIYPGEKLVVPLNPNPKDFDLNELLVDVITTLTNLILIGSIVENNNND